MGKRAVSLFVFSLCLMISLMWGYFSFFGCATDNNACNYGQSFRPETTVAVLDEIGVLFGEIGDKWITAIATVFIAGFTYSLRKATNELRISTDKLWSAGERQASISEQAANAAAKSAEAASRSAEALIATEGAHIVETIESGDFYALYSVAETYPNTPDLLGSGQMVNMIATIRFRNFGKTVAIVSDYSAEVVVGNSPHIQNIVAEPKRLINDTIEHDGTSDAIQLSSIVNHSFEQSVALVNKEIRIWLVGRVNFTDIFDSKRRREFVWVYDRPMRRLVPFESRTVRTT